MKKFFMNKVAVEFNMFGSLVKKGLDAIWIAAWLSHLSGIGVISVIPNSLTKRVNHASSEHTLSMDQYSTSADDKETVACFLDFHEMGDRPNRIKKPLTDLLVIGHEAQSESQ